MLLAASAARTAAQNPVTETVPTMTGPVSCDALGVTLMHEHILWFCPPGRDQARYLPIPDHRREESIRFAASLLNNAARAGIRTLVDVTPHRPIDLYQRIAARTPVRIVVSTGFYRYTKLPPWMEKIQDQKEMEEMMLRDIQEGIGGTSIRAGVIKIATESFPFTDWEKKVFRAAARVQRATGILIVTHGPIREQFDLLLREGANPKRFFLSHADTGGATPKEKLDQMLAIAKEGGHFEVDTFGQEFYTPWSKLTFLLRSLCDAGFANRIFISIDCNWHWEDGRKVFEGGEAPRRDPNASKRTYAYMMTDAVPKLLQSGFTKKEIDTFLIENPRRFFRGA